MALSGGAVASLIAAAVVFGGSTAAQADSATIIANPDFYFGIQDVASGSLGGPGLLSNDIDLEGDAITIESITGNEPGALSWNTDGTFTYTPPAGFIGVKTFSYRITDGTDISDWALVTMDFAVTPPIPPVIPLPYPLVGAPDFYTTPMDAALVIDAVNGVLTNDLIPGGSVAGLTSPTSGTLVPQPDGSFVWTPAAGFLGDATFQYQATDGVKTSAMILVTITVTPVTVGALGTLPLSSGDPGSGSLALTGTTTNWLFVPAIASLVLGALALYFVRKRRANA